MIERSTAVMLRALVAMVVLAAPLTAQQAPRIQRVQPSALFAKAPVKADTGTRVIRETYWKTGALITGIPGFLLGMGLANVEFEGHRDRPLGNVPQTIGLGLVLGVVAAIPGALIGGAIPKR